MNTGKITVWIGALANIAAGMAFLCLSSILKNYLLRLEGGEEALPPLSKLYMGHPFLIFALFAAPLSVVALILTALRVISPETTLLFGAVTVLMIALQMFLAVVALGTPFVIPLVRFSS